MSIQTTPAWKWGKHGEHEVRAWLKQQGFFVLDAHAIDIGGAPAIISQLERYVVPDLQVSRSGAAMWVEVKTKTAPVMYQKTRTWRHGIDLPNWEAYLRVEAVTGITGLLAIYQYQPGPLAEPAPTLLWAPFHLLKPVAQPYGSMVYWDADRFDRFELVPGQPPELAPLREVVHPWERAGSDGVAPQLGAKQEMLPW